MEARSIRLKTMAAAFFSVLLLETVAATFQFPKASTLIVIGILRLLETGIVVSIVLFIEGNLHCIGIVDSTAFAGIRKGVLWSIAFGIVAAVSFLCLRAFGIHPLPFLVIRLPDNALRIFIFFIVGGILAPVAEEIFFRGIIYGFFRRFGISLALVLSTVIFAALHAASQGIPIIQVVGGILFAVAFEVEKNIWVPVTIHILGNLAIFSLSLLSVSIV